MRTYTDFEMKGIKKEQKKLEEKAQEAINTEIINFMENGLLIKQLQTSVEIGITTPKGAKNTLKKIYGIQKIEELYFQGKLDENDIKFLKELSYLQNKN